MVLSRLLDTDKPKLNITYFAPCGLEGGVGGGGRLRNMFDILERLAARIHLVSYLPSDEFRIAVEQVNDHVHSTSVFVNKTFPPFLKAFALLPILAYGLKHIRKSDVVFAHAPGMVSGFPAFVLAKISGRPLVVDHMDIKDPETPAFIYNRVLRNSTAVFAVSRVLEEEARNIGCKNVCSIPIFVDTDRFKKDDVSRAKMREGLGLDEKDIVIGYAGSFWQGEGLPVLLRAFKNLSRRHDKIRLLLIGGRNVPNSDCVPELIKELAIGDRVVLAGSQPHGVMPDYLSVMDIACSPKIDCAENRAANPIKIYEYMSVGLPSVVSSIGEISRVIENGCDGFLVRPGDEAELEKSLEYMVSNPDSARDIGQRARAKIISNYTQEAMLYKVAGILEHLNGK